MSQHYFSGMVNGYGYCEMLMGWDSPTQRHFLVIGEGMDQPIYSNLTDPNCQYTLEYFAAVLDHFGVKIPEALFDNLQYDEEHDIENKEYDYEFEDDEDDLD